MKLYYQLLNKNVNCMKYEYLMSGWCPYPEVKQKMSSAFLGEIWQISSITNCSIVYYMTYAYSLDLESCQKSKVRANLPHIFSDFPLARGYRIIWAQDQILQVKALIWQMLWQKQYLIRIENTLIVHTPSFAIYFTVAWIYKLILNLSFCFLFIMTRWNLIHANSF